MHLILTVLSILAQPHPLKHAQISSRRLYTVWKKKSSDMCNDDYLVYLIKHCRENEKESCYKG